jgi:hypothetical protein
MFQSNTVFIVGAGASKEVGLPIGQELTTKIASLLNMHVEFESVKSGDPQIEEVLKRKVNEDPERWQGNRFIGSARHIGEAMQLATSIDTFLESFQHDKERVLLGKLGIAKAIIRAERASKLGPTSNDTKPFNINGVTNTWYVPLAQAIFSGISSKQVQSAFENVTFIVFNYDRCLQVFLMRALEVYFELKQSEAQNILRRAKFLHPYGSLGSIFDGMPNRVPFGAESVDLAAAAERIATFSETLTDTELLSGIATAMQNAETIVFLGFGYHRQNFEILHHQPISVGRRAARVLGTTHGLSESDTSVVRSMISNLIWAQPPSGYIDTSIHTFGGTCYEFFGEFWRSLTAPVPLVQ